MNEEMLLDGLDDEFELDGLDDEDGELDGLDGEGLAAAVRRRALNIRRAQIARRAGRRSRKSPSGIPNVQQTRAQVVSADVIRSIREIIKTDFYDTVFYDGASETVPFFTDPISKRHKVYRRDGSVTEFAKTQAETNIRKSNELELAQQVKVMGVSLALYTGTIKLNTQETTTEANLVTPEEAYDIIGDTLFRIKIGETERFAVPTRHIPSGADLYGDAIITRGVPNQRNFYSFGRNPIQIKVGESFRPEIVFQQNSTSEERARLEGLKLALRFHTIFARPVA